MESQTEHWTNESKAIRQYSEQTEISLDVLMVSFTWQGQNVNNRPIYCKRDHDARHTQSANNANNFNYASSANNASTANYVFSANNISGFSVARQWCCIEERSRHMRERRGWGREVRTYGGWNELDEMWGRWESKIGLDWRYRTVLQNASQTISDFELLAVCVRSNQINLK